MAEHFSVAGHRMDTRNTDRKHQRNRNFDVNWTVWTRLILLYFFQNNITTIPAPRCANSLVIVCWNSGAHQKFIGRRQKFIMKWHDFFCHHVCDITPYLSTFPKQSFHHYKNEWHPGRLTWNPQITHLERKMIFQTSMIMFHVNLPGWKFCKKFGFRKADDGAMLAQTPPGLASEFDVLIRKQVLLIQGGGKKMLPSGKLTWQWQITLLKMYFLLKMGMFHCYVSLPEGISFQTMAISWNTGPTWVISYHILLMGWR